MILKRVVRKIKELYLIYIKGNIAYARYLGVHIGNDCLIGIREWGTEPYLITIGNHVQVTSGVAFYTHGGSHIIRKRIPDYDSFGKIVVKDWAYIGSGSKLMMGITIGEEAIVASGAVVTKSVPPRTVVGGNPAKIICSTDEFIEKNLKYNLHTKNMSISQKKHFLENLDDNLFVKKATL